MNRVIRGCSLAVLMLIVVAARAPLSHALDEREKGYETALAKGTFQIETGEYGEAITNLKKALEFKPGDKAATQSLGIAYSRSGDHQNAREVLLKAHDIDKTDMRTVYELGVACYQLGDSEQALQYFTEVAADSAEDKLTTSAKRYLDLLDSAKAQKKAGAFTLNVLAGMQNDSNVILEPSNPVVTAERKTDWRAVATVNASYPLMKTRDASAEAGYVFYQSLHERLHDFNVQQHNPGLDGKFTAAKDFQAGLRYRFSYSLVAGHYYSGIHQIMPSLSLRLSAAQSGELYYAREFKKFHDSADFPRNSDRNGGNNSVGATYHIDPNKKLGLVLGYAWDKDSTSAPWWAYTGQKATAGLNTEFAGFKALFGLSYYDQRYDDPFPGLTEKRHDQAREFSVNLVREITKKASIILSELYIKNDSNLGFFDYTRNIVGLFAVMTL